MALLSVLSFGPAKCSSYLREVLDEVKLIKWESRRDVCLYAIVVLVVVTLGASYVLCCDYLALLVLNFVLGLQ